MRTSPESPWLAINGAAYLIISATGLTLPGLSAQIEDIAFPALMGELVFVLWLLVRGAKPRAREEAGATQ